MLYMILHAMHITSYMMCSEESFTTPGLAPPQNALIADTWVASSMIFLSVTHVRPSSLCTDTAAWFKLYPFTSVHAAYSDS